MWGIDTSSWYFYDSRGSLFEIRETNVSGNRVGGRDEPADNTPNVDDCLAAVDGSDANAGLVLGCPPP